MGADGRSDLYVRESDYLVLRCLNPSWEPTAVPTERLEYEAIAGFMSKSLMGADGRSDNEQTQRSNSHLGV